MLGCSAPTAINEKEEVLLSVYPNPIQHILTVTVAQTTSFELCDMQGRVQMQTKLKSGANTLDVSFLSNGIYILKVGELLKQITKE
jgi:hypothetical protein